MDSKVPHLQNTLKDKFCPLFLLQTNLGQQNVSWTDSQPDYKIQHNVF